MADGFGDHEDGGFGVEDGVMDRFDGCDGGFAPLAGAIEDDVFVLDFEDLDLVGVGFDAEDGLGEGYRVFGDVRFFGRGGFDWGVGDY